MQEYPGLVPSNVSKDAKYSVVSGENGYHVRLVFRVSDRERELLTTAGHPNLVAKVNEVKEAVNGVPGGAFYVNEFSDVIVPAAGKAYWAGTYEGILEFDFEGGVISPRAPHGLKPGDPWPGPHVGIRYTLAAGGNDIKYVLKTTPTRTLTVTLSDVAGKLAAARLAKRLASTKGEQGGRIYLNERAEFFAPPSGGGEHIYLGSLDDDLWFEEPDLPRP